MTKTYRVAIVRSILEADPNVVETNVTDCETQIGFWTKDAHSDHEKETGYYSDEGYDWDQFVGLSEETQTKLRKMKVEIQFNDCEGYENEGGAFLE